MVLGTQLRRLREARGIDRGDAATTIRASASKISRMELGRVGFKRRDVADLLTAYGVDDEPRREALLALADEANTPGWWHRYEAVLPEWFEVYLGLEEAADRIRAYEVQFVPGLLQTPDYARAVIELGYPTASDEEIDKRVELRTRRSRLLTEPDPPKLWAVVDETALRRPIGGRRVIREQIRHLLEMAALPHVVVQMVPLEMGGHAAAGGPFSILRFAEPGLPDVVYLEQLTSALYFDKRRDVDHYSAVMDRLSLQAVSRADTAETLAAILKD
jgi:transcriptional regulator with XRE-family HTH domain